jgi:hypothetical protein
VDGGNAFGWLRKTRRLGENYIKFLRGNEDFVRDRLTPSRRNLVTAIALALGAVCVSVLSVLFIISIQDSSELSVFYIFSTLIYITTLAIVYNLMNIYSLTVNFVFFRIPPKLAEISITAIYAFASECLLFSVFLCIIMMIGRGSIVDLPQSGAAGINSLWGCSRLLATFGLANCLAVVSGQSKARLLFTLSLLVFIAVFATKMN